MLGSFGAAVVNNGDYLCLSILSTPEILAAYFFGFQLTRATAALITSSILDVVMPALARLSVDPVRQAAAYYRLVEFVLLLTTPLCFGMAAIITPVVHVLWGGRWDSSAVVALWMLISLPLSLLTLLSRSLLEAKGRWQLLSVLLWGNAFGMLLMAGIGAAIGSLTAMALCVGAWRIANGLFITLLCWKMLSIEMSTVARAVLGTHLIGALAISGSFWCSQSVLQMHPITDVLVGILTFCVLYSVLSFFLLRSQYSSTIASLGHYVLRRRSIVNLTPSIEGHSTYLHQSLKPENS